MVRRATGISMMAVGLMCLATMTSAQDGQHTPIAPPTKHIGKVAASHNEVVDTLIVMNSAGATLKDNQLVLSGVSGNSIIFSNRPVRLAGHEPTTQIIEEWAVGNESFAKDPPNATVSVFSKKDSSVKDAVVVLKSPKLDGDTLTFTVDVLEGDLTGADGSAAIFIDLFGVRRRAFRRGAVYGAAAVGTAAAYGAYAHPYYAHPYYPPPPPPACGYYPQPPCYR